MAQTPTIIGTTTKKSGKSDVAVSCFASIHPTKQKGSTDRGINRLVPSITMDEENKIGHHKTIH
jgi:hypothetical protein